MQEIPQFRVRGPDLRSRSCHQLCDIRQVTELSNVHLCPVRGSPRSPAQLPVVNMNHSNKTTNIIMLVRSSAWGWACSINYKSCAKVRNFYWRLETLGTLNSLNQQSYMRPQYLVSLCPGGAWSQKRETANCSELEGCGGGYTGLAKKFIYFFPYDGSSSSSLSLFKNNFVIVLWQLLCQCVFLKTCQNWWISVHSNIEDGRKMTFSAYYALLFQER